ncbi:hypothetical protein SULYE_0584 [Sulfurihydrogenibium yellowstonense SS-5]|uniref:Uncharacterized protein n=1 Tax=Sulfurihydrogenibium yellowstonense SS-5 TaxID=432331 RepID=C4FJ42_9AQUI|nr:hypothetical protein SULYE_0584 [Sulfurihydrogenibium yellowstonense SS-5]
MDKLIIYSQPTQSTLSLKTACKNPHRHSAAGEKFPDFLLNQKKKFFGLASSGRQKGEFYKNFYITSIN